MIDKNKNALLIKGVVTFIFAMTFLGCSSISDPEENINTAPTVTSTAVLGAVASEVYSYA